MRLNLTPDSSLVAGLDQSDHNMPLSCVILNIVLICSTMYVMDFLCKSLYGLFRLNVVDKKYPINTEDITAIKGFG